ncbi:CPBP family intramembrane metalloprotease [Labedella populi]|uniref:CPBP family intramembrane metalloprotease n=1 Tax=Labedella populi TaxID=2498850 RepID=A0A444QE40_9MICO|nr:type II CAAX endopeptidase family protein [Labedella populi]RWZ67825.1 CPBP family intramembrane metalloprotease [Labedella populi]
MTDRMHDSLETPGSAPSPVRPGWPELLVGVVVGASVPLLLIMVQDALSTDPTVWGLILAATSGVAGLVGFGAAFLVRRLPLHAFAIRKASGRWILLGLLFGVVAFVLKGLVNTAVLAVMGPLEDPQGSYYDAAGGGLLPLILTFLFLAVLTPIGEEFLFRGVITNALLRLGPWVGVVGGSIIFALVHGFNLTLPAAFVVGLIAAEVMRRSGSIWPAVLVHSVNNLALPILVIILQVTGAA